MRRTGSFCLQEGRRDGASGAVDGGRFPRPRRPPDGAEMVALVPGGLPVVDLPEADHQPMLDLPLALVTAVRTLLAFWPSGSAPSA